jgi:hypothetical protein
MDDLKLHGLIGSGKSPEGDAIAGDVLAGKTFSNDEDIGLTGTMPNRGAVDVTLTSEGQEYTVTAGYHSGLGKVKAAITGIVASVIKAGTTVGGVLGTFTSDATATAAQMLSGVTAYVNGAKVTGSIASKSAATYTPGTTAQTIVAGQYLSGNQTIAGDADLISTNIKSGVNIFGVAGNTNVVDTSAGDATAAQILSGKKAYVDGALVTGTIASKSAQTFTPGTANQTIAAEQYLSGTQTIAGDANLVSTNIKAGANIFGVTGNSNVVDTSAGDATSAQILSGKKAYVDGALVTGTIPSKGAQTYTPGTANQTIAAGQYLSGTQTIAGDADLVASNIVESANIFNVQGTAVKCPQILSLPAEANRGLSYSYDGTMRDASTYLTSSYPGIYDLNFTLLSNILSENTYRYRNFKDRVSRSYYTWDRCEIYNDAGTLLYNVTSPYAFYNNSNFFASSAVYDKIVARRDSDGAYFEFNYSGTSLGTVSYTLMYALSITSHSLGRPFEDVIIEPYSTDLDLLNIYKADGSAEYIKRYVMAVMYPMFKL